MMPEPTPCSLGMWSWRRPPLGISKPRPPKNWRRSGMLSIPAMAFFACAVMETFTTEGATFLPTGARLGNSLAFSPDGVSATLRCSGALVLPFMAGVKARREHVSTVAPMTMEARFQKEEGVAFFIRFEDEVCMFGGIDFLTKE